MKILAVLLLFSVFPSVMAQEKSPDSYLCIGDMATGFIYKNDAWQQTHFIVDDSKYLLRHTRETDADWVKPHEWAWVDFGEERAYNWCDGSDSLECAGVFVNIKINIRTLRFQAYFHGTYTEAAEDMHHDTPRIEIGKCTPL